MVFKTPGDDKARSSCLVAETVEGAALALQSIDHIEGSDRLAAGVLCVGHGILNNLLKEDLQNTSGLLVDEAGDALNTTTTRKATDGGLGDTLNVVAQNLTREALSAALTSTFASSLTSSRHSKLFVYLEDDFSRRGETQTLFA